MHRARRATKRPRPPAAALLAMALKFPRMLLRGTSLPSRPGRPRQGEGLGRQYAFTACSARSGSLPLRRLAPGVCRTPKTRQNAASISAVNASGRQSVYKFLAAWLCALGVCWLNVCRAADWPQWGGSPTRNNTSEAHELPTEWNIGRFEHRTGAWDSRTARHIRWVARLGSVSYGTPVVAGLSVYCATNNAAGYVRRWPPAVDLGCLLCFRRSDGRFGWQLSRPKLEAGRAFDWPEQGLCATPLVEGERLWVVTNRCEVLCLDAMGFYDNENDGPYTDEPATQRDEADIVWQFDMLGRLGVMPHNMSSCSVTAAGDLLLVNTSNGVEETHDHVPAPQAPSFIALNKHSGELIWADNSPGANILHGQWSSPAYAVLDGVGQAIFPGGDGWVYSFLVEPGDLKDPKPTPGRRPELLWKFDCNPKAAVWKDSGLGDRANLIAAPVVWEGRVYVATGHDPEFGEAPGRLWCIDPARRGDVSPELVVDRAGKPAPARRICAVDTEAGETVRPNPNSAARWLYTGFDQNADGRLDFKETFHRTLAMPAIKDGLLVITDLAGLVHCLDARTGKVHWTYDMLAAIWAGPLLADAKIYVADEDGDVCVFELSAQQKLLAENNMQEPIYGTPVAVDDTLYIATASHLVAIGKTGSGEDQTASPAEQ